MAKVCQALAYTKSSERIGESRALSCPELCGGIVDGSYGFAVPKLSGRVVDGRYGFVAPKLCGRIGTVAMAVSRQSCSDVSER